jgi:vitamin B12 transporter
LTGALLTLLLLSLPAALMAADPHSLPGLTVHGGERLSSGSRTVIDRELISESGARTLIDVLDKQEGLYVIRYGGAGQKAELQMRGLGAGRVAVLLNGVPLGTSGGGVDLDLIPLERIERIEILKGAHPHSGLAGAVNIITRKAAAHGFKPELKAEAASYGTGQVFLNLPYSSGGHWNYGVSLHMSKSAGSYLFPGQIAENTSGLYELEGRKIPYINTGFAHYGASAVFSRYGDASVLNGVLEYSHKDSGVPGTIEFPSQSAAQAEERFWSALDWQKQYADSRVLGLSLHLLKRQRQYQDFDVFDDASSHALLSTSLQARLQRGREALRFEYGAGLRLESLESVSFMLVQGAELHTGDFRSTLLLSAKAAWMPLGNPELDAGSVLIEGGAQTDYSDGSPMLAMNAGAALALLSGGRLSLRAGGGKTYKRPSFEDLFWPETFFAAGNPDLVPENAVLMDAALHWKPAMRWSGTLSVYGSRVSDMIIWQPSAGGVWRPSNIGRAHIRGLEAGAAWHSPEGRFVELSVRANYALNFAQDKSPGPTYDKQLPRQPYEQAAAGLSVKAGVLLLSMDMQYVGFRFINRANTKYLGDYILVDAFLRALVYKKLEVYVSVKNIFDTPYIHVREYPVPGRELRAGLHYRY